MTVQDIYAAIDRLAPFAAQEKWDNSGLLVGSPGDRASRVLVTLDISKAALAHARETGCDVIVSHHPVIFSPLTCIPSDSIVYGLCHSGIAAICCHTPLDIADGGLNDQLAERLVTVLETADIAPFLIGEPGRILMLKRPYSCEEIARLAKTALGCTSVRFTGSSAVQCLGICTGSGSSLLEDAAGKCDALLTGDVKHDRWYKAQELGLGLIDCGHYHTEVIMVKDTAERLRGAIAGLDVIEFIEGDPCAYV